MSWSFLNASLLWGLPLVGLPLLIHLFNRHRAIPHAFAAMEFVLRSVKKSPRRIQLKSLLLMLLRSLAIVTLILALAGLQRGKASLLAPSSHEPKSVVLMVDASGSMRWRKKDNQRLFDRAREQSLAVLQALGDADEVSVIIFDERVRETDGPLRMGKSRSQKLLRSSQPSFAGTQIGIALENTLALLKGASHNHKEIHIFSDMAQSGWDPLNMPKTEAWQGVGPVKIHLHNLQAEEIPRNLALINFQSTRDPAIPGNFEMFGQIQNFGKQNSSDLPVILSLEGQEVSRSFQKVGSLETSDIRMGFHLPPEMSSQKKAKLFRAKMSIPEDELTMDNERSLLVEAKGIVHMLVVDGDPQPNIFYSETFYLTRALTPKSGENVSVISTSVTLEEFRLKGLEEQSVLVLANVRTLSPHQVELIRHFVAQGGGLWITLGDQVDLEHYNQLFGDLLPARLRDLRSEDFGLGLASRAMNPKTQAIFEEFQEQDQLLFDLPKFQKYVVLETDLKKTDEVLLRLVNGSPILLSRKYGQGRVALWTTSIDRAWNDFPIQTTFLPFIHALSSYLSGRDAEISYHEGFVGHTVKIESPTKSDQAVIKDPSGQIWQETPERFEDGTLAIRFSHTEIPGMYSVFFKSGARTIVHEAMIWISCQPKESDLRKITEDTLTRLLPKESLELNKIGSQPSVAMSTTQKMMAGVSLTPLLLMMLIAIVLCEALVSYL